MTTPAFLEHKRDAGRLVRWNEEDDDASTLGTLAIAPNDGRTETA